MPRTRVSAAILWASQMSPRWSSESVSAATSPSPRRITRGVCGARSLAASPTATFIRSVEVTAATAAHRARYPRRAGQPDARGVGVALDPEHRNPAPFQLLGQAEAHLSEADEQ